MLFWTVSRMFRRFCIILPIAMTMLALAISSSALTLRKSIADAFKAADVVAVVKIEEYSEVFAGNEACGIRYKAKIRESFKATTGGSTNEYITFGRHSGLYVGAEYLLFLKYVSDPHQVYLDLQVPDDAGVRLEEPEDKVIDLIRCDGMIPGLIFPEDLAWQIAEGEVILDGLLLNSVPTSIRIESSAPGEYLLRSADVFAYLRQLK
jgi:hypothetical protein